MAKRITRRRSNDRTRKHVEPVPRHHPPAEDVNGAQEEPEPADEAGLMRENRSTTTAVAERPQRGMEQEDRRPERPPEARPREPEQDRNFRSGDQSRPGPRFPSDDELAAATPEGVMFKPTVREDKLYI